MTGLKKVNDFLIFLMKASDPIKVYTWKKAPFIRLLVPFITGIIIQFYLKPAASVIIAGIICSGFMYCVYQLLPLAVKYKLQPVAGIVFFILIALTGSLCTRQKDIRNNTAWYGNHYHDSDLLLVKINEPPVEKLKSYKAEGDVESVIHGDTDINCKGKILLYLVKDSVTALLKYGDRILINKKIQRISNSGNPGAFNYERYASFQQIFHNVFLKSQDFICLNEKKPGWFNLFIFSLQKNILAGLKKNIHGTDELGIAEALLIGYKEDLDKDLVQAYSNTGVVHIIAISGLHIGLIYIMLVWVFDRIPFIKKAKFLKLLLVLLCLWLFTLLTGASASVLRSAVMFTFIVLGKSSGKKTSIYNSLAVSAFLLLLYDPFFLWDVGFQLSYFAVVGIVAFQQPVYNFFYIKNKWIDKIWKMAAVSIAAQIFTFPVCIYYFHQFPNFFLITNIIAVPLSSLILFAEIFLLAFAWIPLIATWLGKLTSLLLWLMNNIILTVNSMPYALCDQLSFSATETWLLYGVVLCGCYGLISGNKILFISFLICLLCMEIMQANDQWITKNQQQFIVYNVPQQQAMDFIEGNNFHFVGDSTLEEDGLLQNFHLKPARIALRIRNKTNDLPDFFSANHFFFFGNKKILLVDSPLLYEPSTVKLNVDMIILSRNVKVAIAQLAAVFNCDQYILDASNSLWKIGKWKKECEELHLRCHAVSEQGAFISDMGR
ncbi:MAG: ComEC/Rec2 family competence protein [Ferruginibacter sp.]